MFPAIHLLLLAVFITGVTAYTNHTVGGPAGWLFDPNTNTSSANYASWAANSTFHLGDYLIFKTKSNIQMLVLTYNKTTFRSCSIDESSDSDTFVYGQENEEFGQPLTITVPLTIEGPNYFFSSANDRIQCENGMRFTINTSHEFGLPQSPPLVTHQRGGNNVNARSVMIHQPSGTNVIVRNMVCYALVFYGIYGLFLCQRKGRYRIRKQPH